MERIILHSDLNAFYASVEQMLHPELKGHPVAVCGSVEDRHGIVLTKSQLAKEAGVKTGMAIWQAKERCPKLIVVQPHYDQYLKYSEAAHEISRLPQKNTKLKKSVPTMNATFAGGIAGTVLLRMSHGIRIRCSAPT